MLTTLAIKNYRSLLGLNVPMEGLNVITGPNGSGKSNLYKSLRLLSETAQGGVVNALAAEGGLQSTFWAGPETLSAKMKSGEHSVQGGPRKNTVRLSLGFATTEFSYLIELGLPEPSSSAFALDPQIKRECIWNGPVFRPASVLVDRKGAVVKMRNGRQWKIISKDLGSFSSMFTELADPLGTPELFKLRETIRQWRFYDHFRTDSAAPTRQPQLGTRTPVLNHDGHDLAAAMQTIREIGDVDALDGAIADAFPGATLAINSNGDGRLVLEFQQYGLLRPLKGAELSDGTLRYLLWIAALLTPRPPPLMILNEPETSLHPDLLPALARLIVRASSEGQIWVVTHASRLINALDEAATCHCLELEKVLGETRVAGQDLLNEPAWQWPAR